MQYWIRFSKHDIIASTFEVSSRALKGESAALIAFLMFMNTGMTCEIVALSDFKTAIPSLIGSKIRTA